MSEQLAYTCDRHGYPHGIDDESGPICPWCERLMTDQLRAENERLKGVVRECARLAEVIKTTAGADRTPLMMVGALDCISDSASYIETKAKEVLK